MGANTFWLNYASKQGAFFLQHHFYQGLADCDGGEDGHEPSDYNLLLNDQYGQSASSRRDDAMTEFV
jgi:hypothetical protein